MNILDFLFLNNGVNFDSHKSYVEKESDKESNLPIFDKLNMIAYSDTDKKITYSNVTIDINKILEFEYYYNEKFDVLYYTNYIFPVLESIKRVYLEIFNQTIDSLHDAVCIVDGDKKVQYWNKRAVEIYGIKKEEIFEKNITDLFPKALLPLVIDENKSYENVYNNPREDFKNIISARPITYSGELVAAISCDTDISDLIDENSTIFNAQKSKESIYNIHFTDIFTQDHKFRDIIEMAKKVADTNINILITGESGTGKEMIAQSIHNESGRLGSFFPVNCAAIPKELMESEFFGYEKGSFTGALKEGKIGIFELANNGTILLDEIGELPLFMQSKILRFLQDGIFYRVGGHTPIKVDVRILAATNKELKELIEKGKFRKDLFYRLNSIHIELPPLRERIGDIKFLAEKFIIEFCNLYKVNQFVIPHNLYNDLKNNKWEGNIRELRSLMERYVVMKKKGILDTFNYVEQTSVDSQMGEIATMDFNERVKSLENNLINEAISISGGNISKAARILNIPRTTLINKMSSKGHVSK